MVTAQLLSFIQMQVKKGVDSQTLTNQLVEHGWTQQDIIAAFEQLYMQTPTSGMTPTQPYYISTIPIEAKGQHPGRTENIIALICACIALLFLPPVFGILGIILAVRGNAKGDRKLSIIAMSLSVVFLFLGIVAGIWVHNTLKSSASGVVNIFHLGSPL